jgi:hypothetical protein
MEILRVTTDDVATDEDIQNTGNERGLLSRRDDLGIIPTFP